MGGYRHKNKEERFKSITDSAYEADNIGVVIGSDILNRLAKQGEYRIGNMSQRSNSYYQAQSGLSEMQKIA
jgi:hypothetical protein